MTFCISFSQFELKYFFYCVFLVILQIYMTYSFYCWEEKIITEHYLMYSFCFFLGYLLNIIPAWISHIQSKENEKQEKNLEKEKTLSFEYIYNNPNKNYLSSKEILNFLFICLIILLAEIIENIGDKIEIRDITGDNKYCVDQKFSDDYFFIEYLVIFLLPKLGKEVYYKHQYISFFVLILIEIIKNIYFFIKKSYKEYNIISIILNIIYSIFYAIYYIYIKGLMKYKYISPYKCNYMIGIINVPIIILLYFIISFTPLGNNNKDNEYYYDNIFEFFKDFRNIEAKTAIKLISLPFVFGMYAFIYIKIIYDYSIFHMYIPFLIQYFIENVIKNFELLEKVFLISSFFIELIMILVFLEIIEINYCGLNKNLKRNIQSRGKIDSSLAIENDDDDDEIEDEINDEKTKL